jgi:diaminohydroxyphosphoribosylaminopyrimidine deaminase/5-amino-6-(5-phosphoribosylamino)uracil reductase
LKDDYYMNLALELAKSARGQTSPNPLVGAVIVKDGEIVGMGAHLKAGEAHAEVNAIQMAGEKVKGATIYVTLEPCSHYGKTPPCANLVVKSGITRVVIATVDPFPEVAGRGIQILQEHGIQVEIGLLREEADEINRIFYHFVKTKRPYVTIKTATSLDGKIATSSGESKWITSDEARLDGHRYRHEHDAILVGVNTVIKDNPSLTTRLPNGGKNPIRIILDTTLRIPINAKVAIDKKAETWIVTTANASDEKKKMLKEYGIKIVEVNHKQISVEEVLAKLGGEGITSLFVEGGATVNGSFLRSKLVNQVVTYIAPKLIGGDQSPTSFAGQGFADLSNALDLEIHSVEKIGPDIKIVSQPRGNASCSPE